MKEENLGKIVKDGFNIIRKTGLINQTKGLSVEEKIRQELKENYKNASTYSEETIKQVTDICLKALEMQKDECAIKYEQEFLHKFAGTDNRGINPNVIRNAPQPTFKEG